MTQPAASHIADTAVKPTDLAELLEASGCDFSTSVIAGVALSFYQGGWGEGKFLAILCELARRFGAEQEALESVINIERAALWPWSSRTEPAPDEPPPTPADVDATTAGQGPPGGPSHLN